MFSIKNTLQNPTQWDRVTLWEKGSLELYVIWDGEIFELLLSNRGEWDRESSQWSERKELVTQLKYWVGWFNEHYPGDLWVDPYEGDGGLGCRQAWVKKLGFVPVKSIPSHRTSNPWRTVA